jgi:hypothetical protein
MILTVPTGSILLLFLSFVSMDWSAWGCNEADRWPGRENLAGGGAVYDVCDTIVWGFARGRILGIAALSVWSCFELAGLAGEELCKG